MSTPLLQVDLTAGYGAQRILDGVRLEVAAGDRLGLVGTSGAGKTTLVLALMGLLPWSRGWAHGSILLEGQNLLQMKERELRRMRGRRLALVPQSPMTALNGALSLRTHFAEAWRAHEEPRSPAFRQRVAELMRQVHLPGDDRFLARKPSEISVGQAQRIVIALALLHRPGLLIADEPTSALDPATQMEVQDLLLEANRQDGTAILYISHDLLSVLQLCEQMAVLDKGQVVECVSTAHIEKNARHAVTLSLLKTLPVPADVIRAYAKAHAAEAAQGEDLPDNTADKECVRALSAWAGK